MANIFVPKENYEGKFYQKEINSKKFLELSEEQLSILSKKVYKMQEMMTSTLSQKPEMISKLERYQRTLEYLTSPRIYFELKTFDERMAYLIMMVDPNLVMFKEFLKIDLVSIAEINKAENEKERNILIKTRNQTIAEYETAVRGKIGFFDVKLLKYEEMFFKRFFIEKELITEAGSNNLNKFIMKVNLLKDFNSISDERYEELVSVAQNWLSLVPEKYNSKVAAYNVTNQYKLLGLTTPTEQVALFILLTDSNLDMLKIYEEESTMKNIERRIVEQFGYFNKDLLVLEKKFYDRFCPDKNLSVWSKTKKC